MSPEEEKALVLFETRVRQLMLEYRALQGRERTLRGQLEAEQRKTAALQQQLEEHARAYDTLKTARILEVSGEDIQKARARIAGLVREVDKCIALLA